MKKYLLLVLLLVLPQSLLAAATATLDRGIASVGESVQLTIKVEGESADNPDLSVLKQDFDILSQSQSSNYTLLNGSFHRSQQWAIHLMPKRAGTLAIPAISLGKLRTNPLSVQVLPAHTSNAAASKDIFLELTPSSSDMYVQQQLLLHVKLYRAVNLSQAQLSEPSMPHTMVKKLGEDKNYEVVHEQRRFVVTERIYAVFPQQSGTLHIPALQFDGQISSGRGMFSQAGRAIRLQSEALDIRVRPQPQTWAGADWLPAAKVSIREIWADGKPAAFKVGEPFTRTIEIRAKGLTAEQLPALFAKQEHAHLKQYPDQPVLHTEVHAGTVVGVRREKVALIPTKDGELRLPALSVAWWNIASQQRETVEIAAQTISVLPAEILAQPNPLASQQAEQSSPASSLVAIHPPESTLIWQGLSSFFALGWLLTALFWIFSRKHRLAEPNSKTKQLDKAQLSSKQVRKGLEAACRQGDAKAAFELLPKWADGLLPHATIQQCSHLKGYTPSLDAALQDLETCLYGKATDQPWSGDALLQALDTLQIPKHEQGVKTLPSLYGA